MIPANRRLSTALISSFNPNITLAAPNATESKLLSECWPKDDHDFIDIDYYLMMEPDVKRWVERLGIELPHLSAFAFFKSLSQAHCKTIACTLCHNAASVGRSIVALTSFFPEINLSNDDWRGEDCSLVLQSLIRIAAEISLVTGRTPVVQLVAGSLISRFEAVADDRIKSSVLYARRGNEKILMEVVLERIAEALHTVSVEFDGRLSFPQCMRIALELEPGPLYLLRDRGSLVGFCNAIGQLQEPILDSCVGFNLDIAHWWLADRIDPAWLRSHRSVAERIFHAHISGHSPRGHFGDISLARLDTNMVEPFKDWLREISRLPNLYGVSLEMEAARAMSDVEESAKILQQWIAEISS